MEDDTKFSLLIIGFISIIIMGIFYLLLVPSTDTNTMFCPSCHPNFALLLVVVGVIGAICNLLLLKKEEDKEEKKL